MFYSVVCFPSIGVVLRMVLTQSAAWMTSGDIVMLLFFTHLATTTFVGNLVERLIGQHLRFIIVEQKGE